MQKSVFANSLKGFFEKESEIIMLHSTVDDECKTLDCTFSSVCWFEGKFRRDFSKIWKKSVFSFAVEQKPLEKFQKILIDRAHYDTFEKYFVDGEWASLLELGAKERFF